MKMLSKWEKSKATWFLIFSGLIFFLLRLPSLFEPYWYGDEGIYEVVGQAIRHGRLLYKGIWDNKPPVFYYIWGLFNGDQMWVRAFSLVVGLLAILLFFFLAKKIIKNLSITYLVTGVFILLFGSPWIEGNIANAENFMMLPTLLAAYIVLSVLEKSHAKSYKPILLAGLLLGISFLMKSVAVFDFAAMFFVIFVFTFTSFRFSSIVRQIRILLPYTVGFFLPFVWFLLYFTIRGNVVDFIKSAFLSNVGYVGGGNNFIIPQGLLISKLLILGIILLGLFIKRKSISLERFFIYVWFPFTFFDALFSQRGYTHYLLVALASFLLFIGIIFTQKKSVKIINSIIVVGILLFVWKNFILYGKPISYYGNFMQFVTSQKTVTQYRSFFDGINPRDYAIADFLNTRKQAGQSIFIWGNSGQIYALTHTLPPGRYIVQYHIMSNNQTLLETEKDLYRVKPTYVVFLSTAPLPYSLLSYNQLLTIDGATIYERTY